MAEEEKKETKTEEIEEREPESDKEMMDRPGDWISKEWIPSAWVDRSLTEMERMMDELDRTFDRFVGRPFRRRTSSILPEFRTPVLDIQNRGDHYLIEAELPGIDKKDISLELKEDRLEIKGETKKERKEEGEDYVRQERGYSSFYRQIPLPEDISKEEVDATLKNGILSIKLPKVEKEEEEGKKIEIK